MAVSIDLSGKCALVTGGSQGIGRGCGEWLARAGAAVALVARNGKNLEEAAQGIRKGGARAEALAADLTEPGRTEWAVEETVKRLGGIDILVNVAGTARRSDPAETTDDDIDLSINLKVRAAVRLVKAAVPHMRARGGGSIVFILGLAHLQTSVWHGSGCMSNGMLVPYKHQLARRVAPWNIRVNAVNPGVTETPRMSLQERRIAELTGKSVDEVARERLASIPLGRFGQVDDVAKLVLFLCSDLAGHITGESIAVDGGETNAVR
jgi:3-oxoacyl-[acyl-carrier protein] reductase/bacilysin biosynthesis oxidoreductase BacG